MKKIKNTTNDTIHELSNILDKDYFHICMSYNYDYKDNIEWKIYYKNMNDEDFWSEKNTSILSSDKNCISDIYRLKDIFENIKNRYITENHYEIYKESFKLYWSVKELKEEIYSGMSFIFITYSISMCIASSLIKNILLSLTNLCMVLLTGIYMILKNRKVSNIVDKKRKEIRETLLKNIMKRDSNKIIEEIRKEFK